MSAFLRFVVIVVALISISSFAQLEKYDSVKTREKLLFLKDNPPLYKVELKGEFKSEQEKQFVRFYLDHIVPYEHKIQKIIFRIVALRLLMDSASQHNEEELKAWNKEYVAAMADDNAVTVDEKWTETLRQWSSLASGLTGGLADKARGMNVARQLQQFPKEVKNKLDAAAEHLANFEMAQNTAPSNLTYSIFDTEFNAVVREFKSGKIGFEEAKERLTKAYSEGGPHFIGYEAAKVAGEDLNKMAVLRAELAKAKGYSTWAEYTLAVSGLEYEEPYRGLKNQRELLVDAIQKMKPAIQKLNEDEIKARGFENRKDEILAPLTRLFRPKGLEQLELHYPAEQVIKNVETTMLESGISSEIMSQILVDDEERPNKNMNIAYLMPWMGPYTESRTLNLDTLTIEQESLNSPKWKKGLVYVLESYPTGGVIPIRTAFHEIFGHALEAVTKYKLDYSDEAYGYQETPSTVAEEFAMDPDFLFHRAQPVNGVKPTREQITELLSGQRKLDAVDFMGTMTTSLFDIDLWNYDYSKPGAMTFLERVKFVNEKITKFSGGRPYIDTAVPMYYHFLSSGHYISGQVRNIGYLFAMFASRMMKEKYLDIAEKDTGRRSLYQQPSLGKFMTESFYAEGWKRPFPENVEGITGRVFDPESIMAQVVQEIMGCDDLLTSQK